MGQPLKLTFSKIEIAEVIHEAVRVVQRINEEEVSPPWADAPEWMRESTIRGVEGAMEGNTPRESHESWMAERESTGWVYGPVKDVEAKVSPALVPYDDLPYAQKVKDSLFVAVVDAFRG